MFFVETMYGTSEDAFTRWPSRHSVPDITNLCMNADGNIWPQLRPSVNRSCRTNSYVFTLDPQEQFQLHLLVDFAARIYLQNCRRGGSTLMNRWVLYSTAYPILIIHVFLKIDVEILKNAISYLQSSTRKQVHKFSVVMQNRSGSWARAEADTGTSSGDTRFFANSL